MAQQLPICLGHRSFRSFGICATVITFSDRKKEKEREREHPGKYYLPCGSFWLQVLASHSCSRSIISQACVDPECKIIGRLPGWIHLNPQFCHCQSYQKLWKDPLAEDEGGDRLEKLDICRHQHPVHQSADHCANFDMWDLVIVLFFSHRGKGETAGKTFCIILLRRSLS